MTCFVSLHMSMACTKQKWKIEYEYSYLKRETNCRRGNETRDLKLNM